MSEDAHMAIGFTAFKAWKKLTESERIQKFWGNVDHGPIDRCWKWRGLTHPAGYGVIDLPFGEARYLKPHRLAYYLAFRQHPADLFVCHRCDNPPCCNPAHLFLGTAADNARDMIDKGRSLKGEIHYKTRLTNEAVLDIRATARLGRRRRGGNIAEIAAKYGVIDKTIYHILKRLRWSHL